MKTIGTRLRTDGPLFTAETLKQRVSLLTPDQTERLKLTVPTFQSNQDRISNNFDPTLRLMVLACVENRQYARLGQSQFLPSKELEDPRLVHEAETGIADLRDDICPAETWQTVINCLNSGTNLAGKTSVQDIILFDRLEKKTPPQRTLIRSEVIAAIQKSSSAGVDPGLEAIIAALNLIDPENTRTVSPSCKGRQRGGIIVAGMSHFTLKYYHLSPSLRVLHYNLLTISNIYVQYRHQGMRYTLYPGLKGDLTENMLTFWQGVAGTLNEFFVNPFLRDKLMITRLDLASGEHRHFSDPG